MRKFFSRGIFAALLVLAFQGPQLIEQYIDHLQGHVEELKYQMDHLQTLAGEKDLQKLVNRWEEDFREKEPILFIVHLYDRFIKLTANYEALKESSFWRLPMNFLFHLDQGILQEALAAYRWGFTFSLREIPFIILALILGFLFTLPLRGKRMN